MNISGKRNTELFFIFLFAPAMALFLLSGSRSINEYITTVFYVLMAVVSLILLERIKTDEQYYEPLKAKFLFYSVLLAFLMFGVSLGLSMQLKNTDMLMALSSMSLTATPTSVSTTFLSTILYGLAMVATSEELWKLPMFAEGRARWGKGYKAPKRIFAIVFYLLGLLILAFVMNALDALSFFNFLVTAVVLAIAFGVIFTFVSKKDEFSVPGALVYVAVPVGFWACLHGISAYENPVMIIPAFINGVFLIVYLWKFKSILGCVFAHFLYNTLITTFTYLSGSANVDSSLPLFPNFTSASYFSNSGFIMDGFTIALLLMSIFFFLLPTITGEKKKR